MKENSSATEWNDFLISTSTRKPFAFNISVPFSYFIPHLHSMCGVSVANITKHFKLTGLKHHISLLYFSMSEGLYCPKRLNQGVSKLYPFLKSLWQNLVPYGCRIKAPFFFWLWMQGYVQFLEAMFIPWLIACFLYLPKQ